ncbi:N-acetylglucosamine-6-phosphate deacetylase [Shewanella algae]|uniref:N-acetylglucosamine-6-phosphate deacetylase n=1 Tax=Shewanella algae TaxID=38313 RepID=UPI0031F4A54D
MTQTFIAERLFDGRQYHHNLSFAVENGNLQALGSAAGSDAIRLQGLVVPGFIDVQVNGGGGALFNGEPTLECIATIGRAHARFGTTGFLPTLISDRIEVMNRAADAVAEAIARQSTGVLGIHFEGPHLSVPKKGVHPQQYIRRISDAELALFSRQDLGVRLVTLAPENVAPEVIRALVEAGVRVCLGHSNADYDTVRSALAAGASGFTHLYNAMSPLGSRAPGMVGAAIEDEASWCGLIVDGHHVHPAAAKVAIRAKAKGKIILVTDAMPPVGLDQDASFELFGQQVLRQGDRLNAITGELAGCVLDMNTAVRNAVSLLGLSVEESIRMASEYPAAFLGLEQQGHLAAGKRADFLVLDNELKVQSTYIGGQLVYAAEERVR